MPRLVALTLVASISACTPVAHYSYDVTVVDRATQAPLSAIDVRCEVRGATITRQSTCSSARLDFFDDVCGELIATDLLALGDDGGLAAPGVICRGDAGQRSERYAEERITIDLPGHDERFTVKFELERSN